MSDYAYNIAGAYTLRFDHINGHACNCIECCRFCGGCKTTPWHASTCVQIPELRRKERRIISDAATAIRTAAKERAA